MRKANPSKQIELCVNERDCYVGDYPTLGDIMAAYGSDAPAMWLIPQIYNLSEFCGVRNKLEGAPLLECANIIAANYRYLKVSELMLFLYRFKMARYGTFYGNVDPMVILSSLRIFCTERMVFLEKMEAVERQRRRDEMRRNAISYEEYLARGGAGSRTPAKGA